MNELQEQLNKVLLGKNMKATKVKYQKSNIRGRDAKDYVVFIRDLMTGKLFKAEWALANDLKFKDNRLVEFLSKGIIKDIEEHRAGKWGNQ